MVGAMTDMGPIDYLIVEFPDDRRTGEGLPLLIDLVERGVIRLLDLVFIRRNHDDSVVGIALTDFDGDRHLDLTVFQGASSGLVDEDDIGRAAAVLEPGSSAAILIYENLWAAPLATALRRGGAELVAGGRIPYSVIETTLDGLDR
jgi:Family of unknown function (DUF6325)